VRQPFAAPPAFAARGVDLLAPAGVLVLAGVAIAALDRPGGVGAIAVAAVAAAAVASVVYLRHPATVLIVYLFALPLLRGGAQGSSIHLEEVVSGVVAVGGLTTIVRTREVVPKPLAGLVALLMALGLLGLVSSVANGVLGFSDVMNASAKYVIFALIVCLVGVHIDSAARARTLLRAMAASAALAAVYAISMYALGRSFDALHGYSRATGTFENWNELGAFMAMMSFPTLFLAVSARRLLVRGAWLGAWALQVAAMLLSATIGSVVAVVVAAAFGLIVVFRGRLARVLPYVVSSVALVGGALLAMPSVRQHFFLADARLHDRVATYLAGLGALGGHWWLGTGGEAQVLQAVQSQSTGPRVSAVPHNAFLAITVEKGLLGGLLLVLVAVVALRIVLRARVAAGDRLLHAGLVLGIVAFLVQNMSNLLLLNARLGIVFLALVAVGVRLRASSDEPALVTAGAR
jgi:O-antigen ligase